jgi:hypothetical protein
MKLIIIIVLSVASMQNWAQNTITSIHANGIYISDSDYLTRKLVWGFEENKGCRLNDNRSNTIKVAIDSVEKVFYYDEIWGYRKEGIDWRIYSDEFYQVDYVGKVCIYVLTDGMPGNRSKFLYFSTNLTAPLHFLSRKNLISVFHSNIPFVEKMKKYPITKSLEKWDSENNCYRFVTWL